MELHPRKNYILLDDSGFPLYVILGKKQNKYEQFHTYQKKKTNHGNVGSFILHDSNQ